MTIRNFVSDKLRAFGITESQLIDFSIESGLDLDQEYTTDVARQTATSMIGIVEELVFAPRQNSVSESGFSMSWDFGKMGQYYLWLCKKWGVKPNADALTLMGISTISDKTSVW